MKTLSSKQLFLLIGNNNTGKTTVQKTIIKLLCGLEYDKLRTNKLIPISNICLLKMADNIFFANRSFQEKIEEYKSV
jgi:ABC-type oligopeptide transport system ATPase subunit